MLIAELVIVPLGTGTPSVSKYVARAIAELKALGLQPEVTAMGTIFETDDIAVVLEACRRVHESVFELGAQRVVTTLRLDERRDKAGSIEQKVQAVASESP
jgi:uncharacterized protein (TIGR00106 family)